MPTMTAFTRLSKRFLTRLARGPFLSVLAIVVFGLTATLAPVRGLSVREAAKRLGVSPTTAYRWLFRKTSSE